MAINRTIFDGNLTRDAEMRILYDDHFVLNFTVAINDKARDKSGKWIDTPVFVNCAIFGARAEKLAPFLTKGVRVCVDGKLRYNSYTKDDEHRAYLSVIVDRIEFLTPRKDRKITGDQDASAGSDVAPSDTDTIASKNEMYNEDIPF